MCGIFVYSGEGKDGEKKVWEGLRKLEYRGYDSFGIFGLFGDKENLKRYLGKVSGTVINYNEANIALGHTRWATHGKVEERNTHPHISNSGRYILVHNGIFENYLEIKKSLTKKGYRFYSDTDTEVLVNWVEDSTLSPLETIRKLSKKIKGANGFVMLDRTTSEIIAFKNESPLFLGKSSSGLYISSDNSAFPAEVAHFYELKDGEIVTSKNLSKIKWKKNTMKAEPFSKGEYAHFMLKEIFEQGKTLKKAYEKNSPLGTLLGKNWFKGKKIFATGCGTAYNAALVFSTLAAQKNILVKTVPGNEWEQVENLIDKNSILVCFSQSGETIDLLVLAKKFKASGGKVYSILNREFSSLKNISDKYFLINSGQEIAVASTKAFTGMVLTSLKLLNFKITEADFKIAEKFLEDIENFSALDQIVEKFKNSKSIFVLGKHIENYMALETALKIKEVSYIHTEGFASGELKHGVIALIESDVLTIVLGGENKYLSDLENSITQITTRGGEVLFVGQNNSAASTMNFLIPKSSSLGVVLTAISGQILAYKFAIALGLNPDTPRNLAKSVTVK